jgi:dsRNA-specific ribonuclease
MNINPTFTCEIDPDPRNEDGTRTSAQLFRAEVLLPNCIPPKARHTKSKLSWPTEKWAKRDAALEAYIALYRLKLVDDHLMPLLRTDADIDAMKDVEKRPSKVPVETTMNPWANMKWDDDALVYSTTISLRMPRSDKNVEINMLTSVECPPVADIRVFWTNDEVGKVTVGNTICLGVNPGIVEWGRQQTFELLSYIFGNRMKPGVMEFPYLFVPLQPGEWDCSNLGRITNALDGYNQFGPSCDIVINDILQSNLRLVVKNWRTDLSPLDVPALVERYGKKHIKKDQPIIEAVKITKRRDFLHEEANQPNSESTILLLPQYCTLERVPWRFYQLGLFLPGIIRRIEIHLIAADLQRTLLAPVGIHDISLIVTSICASAAREAIDYQRFEFLGDSVLKFLTSVNLVDEHPLWHEGYLARKKDQLVSNARLAKAAQDKRLSRWIITSIFTGMKWAPHYIRNPEILKDADDVETPSGKNELSTKILADVVESLIGASFLEGSYEKALKCINLFVPENELKPLPLRINSMVSRAAMLQPSTSNLRDLEKLLGYTFRHKALLVEAITHPSYTSDMSSISYQRLEFLGDALLDMLVVPWLFHHEDELSHINMHLFKASVVNADFLAFLSLGFATNVGDATVVESARRGRRQSTFELVPKDRKIQLWKFVRHQHPEMASAQTKVWHSYDAEGFRDIIQEALDKSKNYPWTALCGLEADKFFSDIVEALLGAIFVDSGGDFGPVTEFAERLGILRTMRRLVRDGVDVTHPVKKLGELVAADGQGTVTYLPSLARGGKHTCMVQINQKTLVKIEGGSSRAVARVRAAEAGFHTLV